jgi:hypothetical protein
LDLWLCSLHYAAILGERLFDRYILSNFKYTDKALELNTLESELQRSPSPEPPESSPQPEILSTSESIANKTSGHRSTRGKDVSSSYSSLIPKSRDKTFVSNEPVISSDTV